MDDLFSGGYLPSEISAVISALFPALDPILIVAVIAIFLISGIVKGFLGIGLPAAGMALLTLIMSPTEAISLLWLPIIFTNMLQFGRAADKLDIAKSYIWFAITIAISIFVTSLFITSYPTTLLTIAIGLAMVIFSINLLFGLTIKVGVGRRWQIGFGFAAGILGGLSSIWSPPVAMYLIARNTPKDRFIGATGFLFLSGCVPLGAGLVMSGLITGDVIIKSLVGLVTVLIGFRIGEILRHRISQEKFRRFILIAFLIMGARLIVNGLL
ncbi:sulfite exporter TauE/SafE family protein [Alphaproteobacteria bacterium]|nr:sulfite exporter TauE/SafE family protein [Alphaproteobacteria bacterium]